MLGRKTRNFIDKEMKWLYYMVILKEGCSAYSSPVMLTSRKLTKGKRVVTDFRHLNVRIAKNNLAYPLVRDMFSVLGSSKCDVLSELDLKDAFRSLRLSGKLKEVLWNTSIFWQHILFIPKHAHGTEYFPFYLAILYKHNSGLSSK